MNRRCFPNFILTACFYYEVFSQISIHCFDSFNCLLQYDSSLFYSNWFSFFFSSSLLCLSRLRCVQAVQLIQCRLQSMERMVVSFAMVMLIWVSTYPPYIPQVAPPVSLYPPKIALLSSSLRLYTCRHALGYHARPPAPQLIGHLEPYG